MAETVSLPQQPGSRILAPPEYPAEFGARVFKISEDAGTRLTWLKITGGVLQVPEGTKAFYPFAFSRMNNLTAIAIPASVSYIPFTAFNWSENLRDIYFGGSEEAWNELEFAKYGGEILNQITVHFNSTGPISDGWYQEDGKWFYYENGSHITGWKRLPDSHRYYFDGTGVLQHGWLLDNGNWYYLNASGFVVTGWQKLPDGHWYYFNGSGILQHGWLRDGGNWYYLNASGFMVTGWQKLPDGNWYYFNGSGVLQHNWVRYSGNWYYLNASGFMVRKREAQYSPIPSISQGCSCSFCSSLWL